MKTLYVTLLATLMNAIAWAQEKKAEIDVNINKEGDSAWYTSPFVWVVGAAVFILLLVALTRGSGSRAD